MEEIISAKTSKQAGGKPALNLFFFQLIFQP
jgi:hypothetical protein